MPRRVATPKQTGGGGTLFENEVAAYVLAHLLAGRPLLEAAPGRVVRVDTQELASTWHLDDLLVTIDIPDGTARVPFSVKSGPQFAGAAFPADFVRDAWAQLLRTASTAFDESRDWLGFATGPEARYGADVARLLAQARAQHPDDLGNDLAAPGRASAAVRSLYTSAACPADLVKSGEPPPPGRLLRRIAWLPFDFELETSMSRAAAKGLCQDALASSDPAGATVLWALLRGTAQTLATRSGDVDRASLVEALRIQVSLRGDHNHRADWDRVRSVTTERTEGVPHLLGGRVSLARSSERAAIDGAFGTHSAVVLLGASGVGKTVLARAVAAAALSAPEAHVVWASADDVQRDDIVLGLQYPLAVLVRDDPTPSSLVVLDRLDQVFDPAALGRAAGLVRAALAGPGRRVLATCTPEAWSRVQERLLAYGVTLDAFVPLPVDSPTMGELAPVWTAFPALTPLRDRPHLAPVLRRPKVLDLFARRAAAETHLAQADEAHVARWFWERVVADGPDSPARAAAAVAVATATADALRPAVDASALAAADRASVHALVRDGVLHLHAARVSFEHDLYADWVRVAVLRAQEDAGTLVAFLCGRMDSPAWHRAVRLLGLDLLERDGDVAAWQAAYDAFGELGADAGLAQDLLLEASAHAVGASDALRTLWPVLVADGGRQLSRVLQRLLHSATIPDPAARRRFVEQPDLELFVAASARRLYGPYWEAPLRALAEHRRTLPLPAWAAAARVAELWLAQTPDGFPLRGLAAALAVELGERLLRLKQSDRLLSSDGHADRAVYRAVLAATRDDPDGALVVLFEAAGRRDRRFKPPPPTAAQKAEWQAERRRKGLPEFPPASVLHYRRPPEPWPDGPRFRVDDALQHVALDTDALALLIQTRPDATLELVLALLIDDPRRRRDVERREADDLAFEGSPSWYPAFYTRGPFRLILALDEALGVELVLRIVAHATDRWAENARAYDPDRPVAAVRVRLGDQSVSFVGDRRVARWCLQHADDSSTVTSALMALEHHLYERMDDGADLSPVLARLLGGPPSAALLGLCTALGQRAPALFSGPLLPLLVVPELLTWTRSGFVAQSWEIPIQYGDSLSGPLRDAFRAWHTLPHRSFSLLDHAQALLADGANVAAALRDARDEWIQDLQPGGRYEGDPFVEALVGRFDPHFPWQPPTPPPYAPAPPLTDVDPVVEAAGNADDLCRALSANEVSWEDAYADALWAAVQDAEARAPPRVSLPALTGAVASVLLVHGGASLDRHPERASWVRGIILERTTDESGGMVGLSVGPRTVAVPALPVLWSRAPSDGPVRRAVARLAASLPPSSVKAMAETVRAHADALGTDVLRFAHLVEVRAGLAHDLRSAGTARERAEDEQEASALSQAMAKTTRLNATLHAAAEAFVDGSLAAVLPVPVPTEDDDILNPPQLGRRARPQRDVDDVLWIAAATAIPLPDDVPGDSSWTLVWASIVTATMVPMTAPPEDPTVDFEGGDDRWVQFVLDRAALVAATAESDAHARGTWEPVLALGPTASRAVGSFLRAWWGYALYRSEQPAIARRWNEMVGFALSHPRWSAEDARGWHPRAELWRSLVGFCALTSEAWPAERASFVATFAPSLKAWAARHMLSATDVHDLAVFLRLPAASAVRFEGLAWISAAVRRVGDSLWKDPYSHRPEQHSRSEMAVGELLVYVWHHHERAVRQRPVAQAAFRHLLSALVGRQLPVAFELSERVRAADV